MQGGNSSLYIIILAAGVPYDLLYCDPTKKQRVSIYIIDFFYANNHLNHPHHRSNKPKGRRPQYFWKRTN